MIIKIPPSQEVIYTPPYWSVLKFAWVQYFCAFVFWYYLLYVSFYGSLIKARVFPCTINSDFKEESLAARR